MIKVIVQALSDIVEFGIKKGDSVEFMKKTATNSLFENGGKQFIDALKNQKGIDLSGAMGKYRGNFKEILKK